MRRIAVLVGLCALLLPIAAWADGIDLVNQYGTVTITNAGVVSTNSELIAFGGITAPPGHALGYVSYSTGALTSGSILGGGTFSSVGSSFLITGKGNYGEPKGVIFSGAFVGPISWTLVSHPSKFFYTFNLTGEIEGTTWRGHVVTGMTTQTINLYSNQWNQDHKGSIHIGGEHLNTPEPGTLGLLGTGLIAIAGAMRRKLTRL